MVGRITINALVIISLTSKSCSAISNVFKVLSSPTNQTTRLIWPSHYPRRNYKKGSQVKHIPQTVLDQLDAHLQYLLPTYIPIVILLRASGWRISDVLSLKLDTCLEQDGDKFWLVGDIQKPACLVTNSDYQRGSSRYTHPD